MQFCDYSVYCYFRYEPTDPVGSWHYPLMHMSHRACMSRALK